MRNRRDLAADAPPAPPPRGSVQQIPADQFESPAAKKHTKNVVDVLVRSKGYDAFNKHRKRFENTTYLSGFGLLTLFGFTYADFIAIVAMGKVPSADAVGSLLVVSPYWLAVLLTYVAALVLFPCAFMTPWSSLFFELDEWEDLKGVLFFQALAITVTSIAPFYHFGSIHEPCRNLAEFFWNFAALAAPCAVGVVYYAWRSQHWQRAVGFTTIPLWVVPCIFGIVSFALYDVIHYGSASTVANPAAWASVLMRPSVKQMRHFVALFQLHSWTSLIFSYLWYILPKF